MREMYLKTPGKAAVGGIVETRAYFPFIIFYGVTIGVRLVLKLIVLCF